MADGIYYVPYNTDADTIIWSGLYDCSGVIIDGTNRWGYMLVFAGSAYVKQIYFQNNSPLILVRQRHDGDEWSSWKELALKDDTLSYEANNSDMKMFSATSVNGGFFEVDVNTTNEKYQLLFQTTQKRIIARYFNGEQWNDQVVASWS